LKRAVGELAFLRVLDAPYDRIRLSQLEAAASVVYEAMGPTPQQRWPLLDERCGAAVWVKHENHTPVGAFKVRGVRLSRQEIGDNEGPALKNHRMEGPQRSVQAPGRRRRKVMIAREARRILA
jgi:hypothetical protein